MVQKMLKLSGDLFKKNLVLCWMYNSLIQFMVEIPYQKEAINKTKKKLREREIEGPLWLLAANMVGVLLLLLLVVRTHWLITPPSLLSPHTLFSSSSLINPFSLVFLTTPNPLSHSASSACATRSWIIQSDGWSWEKSACRRFRRLLACAFGAASLPHTYILSLTRLYFWYTEFVLWGFCIYRVLLR